jgi:hypothetical protein
MRLSIRESRWRFLGGHASEKAIKGGVAGTAAAHRGMGSVSLATADVIKALVINEGS